MTSYHLKTQLNQNTDDKNEGEISPSLSAEKQSGASRVYPNVYKGQKPALRNWKISSPPANSESSDSVFETEDDLFSSPLRAAQPSTSTPLVLKIAHAVGVFVTVAWLVYAVSYLFKIQGGIGSVLSSPLTMGGVMAGVLAPVALIWLALASWQRRSDATLYAEALRGELQRLLFPTQDQAHKVNADIQTLVAQAVEMSSSSRAAIKAIQRARHGLRSEIRDFAGVSQKTEFHIDRLSETLNARAEQLLLLTQKIEDRTNNIQQGSAEGVMRWTEATNTMLERASQTSAHVETVAEKIMKAQQSLSSQASILSEAGIRIANESQNFEQSISQNINRFESLTSQSRESLDSVHTLATEQERALTALVARNHEVHEKISLQSVILNKAVLDLSQKTSDLDAVGQTAAHKLGEALSMALSGSDAITSAVRKTREQIERSVSDANVSSLNFIGQAEQKVSIMVQSASEQFAKLEAMMQSFEKREQDLRLIMEKMAEQNTNLVTATDLSVAKLTDSSDRLINVASSVKQKIAEPVAEIDTAASQLAQRANDIQKTLTDRIADINAATEIASAKANEISSRVRTETQNLSTVTGQLLAHAKGIEQTIDTHKEKLDGFVSSTEMRLDHVGARVKDHSVEISNLLQSTQNDLSNIASYFARTSDETTSKSRIVIDDMRTMEQSVLDQLLALAAQAAQTQITMQNMELTLRDTVKEAFPVLDETIQKADIAQSRFQELRNNYDVTSDSILERLANVNQTLDTRLNDLNSQTQSVARNLSNLTHELGDAVERIDTSANKADQTLTTLQSSLQGQADQVHLLTDQTRLKVEAMQKLLGQNTSDISVSVGQALSQLEEATSGFKQSADILENRSVQSTEKLDQISKRYSDEAVRIIDLSEDQAQKSIQLLSGIKDHAQTLSAQSKQALADLQRANDTIAVRVREVDEYMKSAIRNTQNYNDDLKSQAQLVASVSAETVDQMAEQISRLSLKADEARDIGQRLVTSIDVSRAKLVDETERLGSVARKAVDTADDAASAFSRQSVTLYKAVQDVATYAERVKETQLRNQRDAFLSSAKFVIESLHSLAVDVARHLESDIDDRIWKQYQKGDMSSFTKRLMELSNTIDMPRAQKKFAEDGEFRNYVQRFIRGFEELFEQAQSNDHGQLLSSIFSTSQIGRVYGLLCDISGRNSKLN
jgi:chromosome segregation ATPase